jgi:hypothetical protein
VQEWLLAQNFLVLWGKHYFMFEEMLTWIDAESHGYSPLKYDPEHVAAYRLLLLFSTKVTGWREQTTIDYWLRMFQHQNATGKVYAFLGLLSDDDAEAVRPDNNKTLEDEFDDAARVAENS